VSQNTKNILITGAMGFIGSHTAKAFQKAGYRVIGIDRQITIPAAAGFIDELIVDDFANMAAAVAVERDVCGIIHIAGTSLVGPSIKNPGEYYDNNVGKTNTMLENLAKQGWQGKIIFSSSAAVYGNDYTRPWKETDSKNPISPYGHSKSMCEQIISDHSHARGHRGIALRYFNACGCDPDGELGNVWNDSHLVPSMVQSTLEKIPMTINGIDFSTPDGTCIRDYLHVSDIAEAHVLSISLGDSLDKGEFRVYNLGTGKGISNLEIVRGTQKGTMFNYGPRRFGDPDELVADPTRFMTDTVWKPKYSQLDTIVSTTFNWMKDLK
jgi:UDP-glucose-4-epimerase GalE